MGEKMKDGMHQEQGHFFGDAEAGQVCFRAEDGAWYDVGAVVCNNGHDWECKPSGKWAAKGSSDSCSL